MQNDTDELSSSLRKLRAVRTLIIAGRIAFQLGELFQETASLVFVFVPLELWDKRGHGNLIEWTLLGTFLSFCVGLGFRGISAFAFRFKEDLEGKRGDPGSIHDN